MVSKKTMHRYRNFQEKFITLTNASDRQLGDNILQKGSPIAFFSRVLNKAQKKYTTIDKEILSIMEMLKEFRTILYGQIIKIHTDHKNLTYQGTQHSQRVLRHRLLFEEYGVKIKYIPGKQKCGRWCPIQITNHTYSNAKSTTRKLCDWKNIECPVDFEILQKEQQKANITREEITLKKTKQGRKKIMAPKNHKIQSSNGIM